MAKKKNALLTHLLVLAVAPLFFACAHATTEEVASDGYAEEALPSDEVATEALVEDIAFADSEKMEGYELAEPSSPELEAKIATAQAEVTKPGRPHKAITHPYSAPPAPAVAKAKPAEKPITVAETQAVVRNGSTLNRYYFLRQGDTAESVANLVYGTSDRAAELVEWNGAAEKWVVGAPVYYRSPQDPQDKTLVSYYFERGVASEEINIEPGEDLKDLALRRFGSSQSWPEIAAASGIRGAHAPVGTVVKAYPVFHAQVAQQAAPQAVNRVAVMPPNRMPAHMMPKPKTRAELASTAVMGFVKTRPLLASAAFLSILLAATFYFVQRRRQRSRFDF
ncbi:hypothetical protein K2X33_06235 [bacterium]|nr:hypothetical protein [bacterium]